MLQGNSFMNVCANRVHFPDKIIHQRKCNEMKQNESSVRNIDYEGKPIKVTNFVTFSYFCHTLLIIFPETTSSILIRFSANKARKM